MDIYELRALIVKIDHIPAEDMEHRIHYLDQLYNFAKNKALQDERFERHDTLEKILRRIDLAANKKPENRYIALVGLMIFLKRQALLDPSYEHLNHFDARPTLKERRF